MNRAALVTGASSGIGRAIAQALAEDGWNLTIAARRADRLEAARAALLDHGVQVQAVPADVAEEEQLVSLVERHRQRYGRLDLLVNNAGVGFRAPLDGYSTKFVDVTLGVNVRGTIILCREALPMLREAGAEHRRAFVINTSSLAGKLGEAGLTVYAAAKHALVGFTDALNRELIGAGIRACVLCPGYVDTPMSDYAKEYIPADEMIRPEDLAETVRYLLRLSPTCVVPELVLVHGQSLRVQEVPLLAAVGVPRDDLITDTIRLPKPGTEAA
ncbi:MAG TPA: SDR family oxidoreductase [Solirubrobacteraceae bacterium]|jgi:NAD(P)-dependent dehydrogenase (short-subunit alcohol dehydrogenase family)